MRISTQVYHVVDDNQEAIDQLVPLSREAPDEAQVFFLLGKCLLRKDRGPEAQVAFTAARDLQPKLAAAIDIAEAHNGESEEEEDE
jgi:anaphase-promoting complex subunit 3